jgi:hypothetical protein
LLSELLRFFDDDGSQDSFSCRDTAVSILSDQKWVKHFHNWQEGIGNRMKRRRETKKTDCSGGLED